MGTTLAQKPASYMRQLTQPVRDHAAAMARLTDQYHAALKRAEAQYFEGVKRITDAVTAETETSSDTNAPPQQPATTPEQPAA